MELARIEALLDAYFEGNTSLLEEAQLKDYFATTQDIPAHLQGYRDLFVGLVMAREETSTVEIELPESRKRSVFWRYGVAASLVLGLGFGWYFYTNTGPNLTQEEQQALAAYEDVRSSMLLLSQNLNEGTQHINYINEFGAGARNISLIDQFNQAKSKILK